MNSPDEGIRKKIREIWEEKPTEQLKAKYMEVKKGGGAGEFLTVVREILLERGEFTPDLDDPRRIEIEEHKKALRKKSTDILKVTYKYNEKGRSQEELTAIREILLERGEFTVDLRDADKKRYKETMRTKSTNLLKKYYDESGRLEEELAVIREILLERNASIADLQDANKEKYKEMMREKSTDLLRAVCKYHEKRRSEWELAAIREILRERGEFTADPEEMIPSQQITETLAYVTAPHFATKQLIYTALLTIWKLFETGIILLGVGILGAALLIYGIALLRSGMRSPGVPLGLFSIIFLLVAVLGIGLSAVSLVGGLITIIRHPRLLVQLKTDTSLKNVCVRFYQEAFCQKTGSMRSRDQQAVGVYQFFPAFIWKDYMKKGWSTFRSEPLGKEENPRPPKCTLCGEKEKRYVKCKYCNNALCYNCLRQTEYGMHLLKEGALLCPFCSRATGGWKGWSERWELWRRKITDQNMTLELSDVSVEETVRSDPRVVDVEVCLTVNSSHRVRFRNVALKIGERWFLVNPEPDKQIVLTNPSSRVTLDT